MPCQLVEFDHLISQPIIKDGQDFKDFVTPVSRAETSALGDPCLRTTQKGEVSNICLEITSKGCSTVFWLLLVLRRLLQDLGYYFTSKLQPILLAYHAFYHSLGNAGSWLHTPKHPIRTGACVSVFWLSMLTSGLAGAGDIHFLFSFVLFIKSIVACSDENRIFPNHSQ